jgi:hypothetical protein
MDDKRVDTTEHMDHLFNKVWDKVLTKGYILSGSSLPSEQQILESWRIVQDRLNPEQIK